MELILLISFHKDWSNFNCILYGVFLVLVTFWYMTERFEWFPYIFRISFDQMCLKNISVHRSNTSEAKPICNYYQLLQAVHKLQQINLLLETDLLGDHYLSVAIFYSLNVICVQMPKKKIQAVSGASSGLWYHFTSIFIQLQSLKVLKEYVHQAEVKFCKR